LNTQGTRERILSETSKLISEAGYSNISAKKIAARCEVSDSLIFKYFKTLDNLYSNVYDARCQRLFNVSIPAQVKSLNEYLPAYLNAFEEEVFGQPERLKLWYHTREERPDIFAEKPVLIENSGPFLELKFRLSDKKVRFLDAKLLFLTSTIYASMRDFVWDTKNRKAVNTFPNDFLLDFIAL
jgi:AcrR family transcriptional regulator